jgi:glucose/arabinose dehydrogenase
MLIRLLIALVASLPLSALAQTLRSDEHSFRLVKVVEGLEQPWSLAFLPDGRVLVTEKAGRLRVVAQGKLLPQPIEGLPQVTVHGQGGLHDVVLHPQFQKNQLVYLAYAARGSDGVGTELARGRLVGDRLENVEVLFRQTPKGSRGQHFGGRIVFDRQGYLYLTLGDRGEMPRAQRPDDHAGSVIRLHDDGRVPKDNPFVGRNGWKPEKFTLGNRNMQGAALHPQTGLLWTHEHGPQGGDEVNVLRAGRNYGWPVITYGEEYGGGRIGEGLTHKDGMEQPLHYWVPSIAPSGMAFVTGDRYGAAVKGNLFVGSLKFRYLARLEIEGGKVVRDSRALELGQRVRDVREGPDGLLYLLTDEDDGRLVRVRP